MQIALLNSGEFNLRCVCVRGIEGIQLPINGSKETANYIYYMHEFRLPLAYNSPTSIIRHAEISLSN